MEYWRTLCATDSQLAVESREAVVSWDREREKVLPLTVMFYEGPIARAYLQTLKSLGFKPERIVHMVSSNDLASGKAVGTWLPSGLRKTYAASLQRQRIHYWPKTIAKRYGLELQRGGSSGSGCV